MSAHAVEQLTPHIDADDFHALEEKIYRTIEQLKAAREAKAVAERMVARLRQQMEERAELFESLRQEVVTLRRDREEVRTRIEKMLKQIDALTAAESGA